MPVFRLHPDTLLFPPTRLAEPDGLLAVGGDLSPERLLLAYRQGIFPWYSDEEPILWWSPAPRLILLPENLRISRRLARTIRKQTFQISFDTAFAEVVAHCAGTPRPGQPGTWITAEMQEAYGRLHELGFAHSVEARQGEKLVGGLYGLALGGVFFGESMFSLVADSSKVAFAALVERLKEWDFGLIDCQVATRHLLSLGAHEVEREEFERRLALALAKPTHKKSWQFSN